MPDTYDTMKEALDALYSMGFTYDFNLAANNTTALAQPLAEDCVITRIIRFEHNSDPGENAILYAIEVTRPRVKGTLVNAFGIYADPQTDLYVSHMHLQTPIA